MLHAIVSFAHLLWVQALQSEAADADVEPLASAAHSSTHLCWAQLASAASKVADEPPSHAPASEAPHTQAWSACLLVTALHDTQPPSHVGAGVGATL